MGILKKLDSKYLDRKVLFTAIEELKNPDDIRQFYKEYVACLRVRKVDGPEHAARADVLYALGYYEDKRDIWLDALGPEFKRTARNAMARGRTTACL